MCKASGNIESSQNVKGATLESTGRTTVGEFIQLNGRRLQLGLRVHQMDYKEEQQKGKFYLVLMVYGPDRFK